jgi:hypothetical protein
MDEAERQRLTEKFTQLLYQYEQKNSLEVINQEYDRRNQFNPWVRMAMELESQTQ